MKVANRKDKWSNVIWLYCVAVAFPRAIHLAIVGDEQGTTYQLLFVIAMCLLVIGDGLNKRIKSLEKRIRELEENKNAR